MAKKRGGNPLGNAFGAQEAQQIAAKAHLTNLKHELALEVERSGQVLAEYIKEAFGVDVVSGAMIWQLASGAKAAFHEINLSYAQVRDNTFVNFDINGREQTSLTAAALEDLNSLALQQFYPAVGREINGKIEVLDGSRRRAWFLLQQGDVAHFRILVTQDVIELSDAKMLAKQLQSAKEHNLREVGLQCLLLQQNQKNIRQSDIAKQLGLSQSAVSKAIKAANIDERLIRLFPVVNLLSHPDYTVLNRVMKLCSDEASLANFMQNIATEVVNIQAEYSEKIQKEPLLAAIKKELKVVENKEIIFSKVTDLHTFKTQGMFARKRVKDRQFSYEFGRLSKEVQKALDNAILEVLQHLDK